MRCTKTAGGPKRAISLTGVTLVQAKPIVPFDKDIWELYDRRNDFSLATDLAAKHPEKLKELQKLFEREAPKYNVYPMADNTVELHLFGTPPRLFAGNKASLARTPTGSRRTRSSTSRTGRSPSSPRSTTRTARPKV